MRNPVTLFYRQKTASKLKQHDGFSFYPFSKATMKIKAALIQLIHITPGLLQEPVKKFFATATNTVLANEQEG